MLILLAFTFRVVSFPTMDKYGIVVSESGKNGHHMNTGNQGTDKDDKSSCCCGLYAVSVDQKPLLNAMAI
jgi:hypothetical protein